MHKWDGKLSICVQTGFKSGAKIVKKTQLEQKRATSIPTAICYTLLTFAFPRTTKKQSKIVKENLQKNNITFTVRHVTNDLKMLPFRTLFFIHFDVFFEFWPRRTPVPSQSHKKDLKQEPRGCHELPRRSQKGATMSPRTSFLVKRRLLFASSPT